MQEKFEAFKQAQAEFSASFKHLQSLNKEIDRQEKILNALDVELADNQAAQEKGKNSAELPKAGQFLKLYQQKKELTVKKAGIQQFIQQIAHNRQALELDLVEYKRRLINAHSDLMEALSNQIFEALSEQITEPLNNAILTMMKSAHFIELLRNRENTLRENIDPLEFILDVFLNNVKDKMQKYKGEITNQEILKYQLNFNELDEIPEISPIKLQQLRQALKQSTY